MSVGHRALSPGESVIEAEEPWQSFSEPRCGPGAAACCSASRHRPRWPMAARSGAGRHGFAPQPPQPSGEASLADEACAMSAALIWVICGDCPVYVSADGALPARTRGDRGGTPRQLIV